MGFVPSAKMMARKTGVDIASLIDILSYRRPFKSEGEQEFLNVVIDTVDGMITDEFGNRYLRIAKADGSQSDVMWSCHTDSVHSPIRDGIVRQNIRWDGAGNILSLNEGKPGQCLGADDGAGVWIMLEMIKAGKPGLYMFHRGEEVGGQGSHWIDKNTPEVLDGIRYAIAFDRKDLSSIITFQGGMRCCSDAFGYSLASAINRINGMTMKLDTTGSFTDTAVYTDTVAECTNVSVGYYSQHGPRETLDVRHMLRLRDAMLQIDPDADFVCERTPGDRESKWKSTSYYGGYGGGYTHTDFRKQLEDNSPSARAARAHSNSWGGAVMSDDDAYEAWLMEAYGKAPLDDKGETEQATRVSLLKMVKNFPETAVNLLMDMGVDQWDFADTVLVSEAKRDPDADLAGEDDDVLDLTETHVECDNCKAKVDVVDVDDDLRCPYCYTSLQNAMEEVIAAQNEVMDNA